jgi:nitroimidazol reductase NimA-like FMN-containing flavoprotein (pyridoxamine 5'-phosphate oxidase superfamily)
LKDARQRPLNVSSMDGHAGLFSQGGKHHHEKKWRCLVGTAKFREETSKKADSAVRDRIAARQKLVGRSFVCKRYFAMQHCEFASGIKAA